MVKTLRNRATEHSSTGLGVPTRSSSVGRRGGAVAAGPESSIAGKRRPSPSPATTGRSRRASSPLSSLSSLASDCAYLRTFPAEQDGDEDDIAPEIVVWTEEMEVDTPSQDEAAAEAPLETDERPDAEVPPPPPRELSTTSSLLTAHSNTITTPAVIMRESFASSNSALTDQSELSSLPSSLSSKATTPAEEDTTPRHVMVLPPVRKPSPPPIQQLPQSPQRQQSAPPMPNVSVSSFHPPALEPPLIGVLPSWELQRAWMNSIQPKSSLPSHLPAHEYAHQCIEAAESSRLNPYALHRDEYSLLRAHITHGQVTTYLNIRNGILRLWLNSPCIAVTREEAIGCAPQARWFDAAAVCYDWLVRAGYINHGCVEIPAHENPQTPVRVPGFSTPKRRTIVVIGAGMSGLSCARQLEGLIKQYGDRFAAAGEAPPRVIVVEGRSRIGGRVYSREFKTKPSTIGGSFAGQRCTAEMGGMIITGFERGNPMNILVRAQLGLPYHALQAETTIYDSDGRPVNETRDQLVENLYNDCLERASEYKWKTQPSKLIEGSRDLLNEGKDSEREGNKTISYVEEATAALPHAPPVSEQNVPQPISLVPVSSDKLTGKVHNEPGTPTRLTAAERLSSMGWILKAGVNEADNIDLDAASKAERATLGSVLDEAITQSKNIVDLNAQDFRLLNWHIANLEYSNATNLHNLSLGGWDLDTGNEWEGRHTMVVGGYQSVPRGLMRCPTPLDVRTNSPVKKIVTQPDDPFLSLPSATVVLEDGEIIPAEYVVSTIPLGILKEGSVEFEPPLPTWKSEAINRLGWGVLNKVVLIYREKDVFWDKRRHIFGVLRNALNRHSVTQADYASQRGRFFQWFNVSDTTGLPCLIALMAGDAAYATERTPNDQLVAEATEILRSVFGARVPYPVEAVVTRWESDRFARGSYSSSGPDLQLDDYDAMARRVRNIFFAGEHTIGTHPATVHGAYLSGLRAASEVIGAILGPIEVPVPLIPPKEAISASAQKRKDRPIDARRAKRQAYDDAVATHIRTKIGDRPWIPLKVANNPYIFYSKVSYDMARQKCDEGRRPGKRKAKAGPNEVRVMMAKMWKEATPEERKPFEDMAAKHKRDHAEAVKTHAERVALWDVEAARLRREYEAANPYVPSPGEDAQVTGGGADESHRRKKNVSYAEDDSDMEF